MQVFNWTKLIDIAKSLYNNKSKNNEEAYLRTAINRAYYAVFCTIRDGLEIDFDDKKTRMDMRRLGIRSFHLYIQHIVKNIDKRFGILLEELHRFRKWADYETVITDKTTNLKKLCFYAISKADIILKNQDRLGIEI